ncbi:MAG: haloacid dehalogenase-like hydrolase [Gemmatimonadota bacterium]
MAGPRDVCEDRGGARDPVSGGGIAVIATIVFDIDGTLTDTMDVDVECFEDAIRAALGVALPRDWPTLHDVTDVTVLAAACERGDVPMPDLEAQGRIADEVGRLLEARLAEEPHRFRAIPGATEVFEVLAGAGWNVAMATGAWRPSALVKLRGGGIPYADVPLATCSDHPTRVDIIREALRASSAAPGEPIVYIGDGVWDGKAARSLGCGFVGVAPVGRKERLLEAGADVVIEDFRDAETLVEELSRLVQ